MLAECHLNYLYTPEIKRILLEIFLMHVKGVLKFRFLHNKVYMKRKKN